MAHLKKVRSGSELNIVNCAPIPSTTYITVVVAL